MGHLDSHPDRANSPPAVHVLLLLQGFSSRLLKICTSVFSIHLREEIPISTSVM